MTKKVKNLIEKIEKTADEIDGLSLNDNGAWEKILNIYKQYVTYLSC